MPPGRVVLLTSGEMIPRKNQEVLFRMLAKLKDSEKESVLSLERNETADEQEDAGTGRRVERCSYERLHLLLCGHGELKEYLQDLAAQLGIADHISFLGYREDMAEIFGARISSFFRLSRKDCRVRCWRRWRADCRWFVRRSGAIRT